MTPYDTVWDMTSVCADDGAQLLAIRAPVAFWSASIKEGIAVGRIYGRPIFLSFRLASGLFPIIKVMQPKSLIIWNRQIKSA